MLTAIQARKARLQHTRTFTDDSTIQNSPEGQQSPATANPRVASSKRKFRDGQSKQTVETSKTKRTRRFKGMTSYSDVDDRFLDENVISVDEDTTMSDLDNGALIEDTFAHPRVGIRSWSPSRPFHDSSEDDTNDLEVLTRSHDPSTPLHQPFLSSFIPEMNVNTFLLLSGEISEAKGEKAVVLIVPASQTIAFIGVYSLTVLKGSISICGTVIGPSNVPHRIFAPRCSPIPVLESLGSKIAMSKTFIEDLPQRVRVADTDQHTVLLVRELRTGVEGLTRIIQTFQGVFEISPLQAIQPIQDLGLSGVYFVQDVQPLTLPSSWLTALSVACPNDNLRKNDVSTEDGSPIVCYVTGPRNSGKSTFARTLVNRLISRYKKVAFLDCDPGQSEFTPNGLVALTIVSEPIFGQPFTHPTIPYASHFIGSSTPRNSPSQYLSAVEALIQTYRIDIQYASEETAGDSLVSDIVPLVVNTMGWTKGLGADLNAKIEELVEPTDVFVFDNLEYSSSSQSVHSASIKEGRRVHVLAAIAPSGVCSRYTSADHRALTTLSYFYAKSLRSIAENTYPQWETALPLCAKPPYEVDIKTAFDIVLLVGSGSEDIVSAEIQRVLNGSIVAFVESEDESAACHTSLSSAIPYKQGLSSPSALNSNCIGLGIIRSLSETCMHIITPVPPPRLARSRVLVKGDIELPVWGMLDFRAEISDSVAGVERSKVPYLRWGKGEGLGSEKRKVRRNLMRRGQQ